MGRNFPHRSHEICDFEICCTVEIDLMDEIRKYIDRSEIADMVLIEDPDPETYGQYCDAPGYYQYLPSSFGKRRVVSKARITDPDHMRTYAALKAIKDYLDTSDDRIHSTCADMPVKVRDGRMTIDMGAKELLGHLSHIAELEEHINWIQDPACMLRPLYDQ